MHRKKQEVAMEGSIRAFIKKFYLYTTLVEYCVIIPVAIVAIALATDIPSQQLYSILMIIGIVAVIALIVFPPVQKYMFRPFIQMADALKEGKEIDVKTKILIRERLFGLPILRSFVGIVFWLVSIVIVVTGMWAVHIDIETILICCVVGACVVIAVGFAMIILPLILIVKFIKENEFIKEFVNYAEQKNISFWGSLRNALTVSICSMVLLAILFVATSNLLFVFKLRIKEYSRQMAINVDAVANDIVNLLDNGVDAVRIAAKQGSIDTLQFMVKRPEIVDAFIVNNQANAVVTRSLLGRLNGVSLKMLGMSNAINVGDSFIGNFVWIPQIKKSIVVCAVRNNAVWYGIAFNVNELYMKRYFHYKIGDRGYLFITDTSGLFLAHPREKYIGNENLKNYSWGSKAFETQDIVKYFWEGERKFLVAKIVSVPAFAVVQTIYERDIGGAVKSVIIFVVFISTIVIVLGIIAAVIILTSAFHPFTSLQNSIYTIADGNIQAAPTVIYGNEIGIIATSVSTLTAKVGSVISQVKNSSEELSTASEQLSAGINTLSEVASSQSASTEEITATIEEISANLDAIVQTTKQESASLGEFSEHLKVLSQSIFSFLLIMEESVNRTETITSDAQKGQLSLQQMNTSMQKIVESSRGISNIAQIIRGIADQVNLLALNAAIEAARAGEAGRGFAVVADEITKLADQIAQSLKDIDVLVKNNEREIQQGINITQNTVAAISSVIQGIESISNDVQQMGQKIREQSEIFNQTKKLWDATELLSRQILDSVEDQKIAIDEIVKSINTINSLTQNVAGTAEEMNSSAENLASMAENLKAILQYFRV